MKTERTLQDLLEDAWFTNDPTTKGFCDLDGRYLCGTPLHIFATRGDLEACLILLDAGANVDILDGDGYTQLHAAVEQGHTAVVILLLERGSDPSISTPLDTIESLAEDSPETLAAIKLAEQDASSDAIPLLGRKP